jgi:hypothetical protein
MTCDNLQLVVAWAAHSLGVNFAKRQPIRTIRGRCRVDRWAMADVGDNAASELMLDYSACWCSLDWSMLALHCQALSRAGAMPPAVAWNH